MRTDQVYIRKAVELSDGFKWYEITTLDPTDHSWIKLPEAFGWTEPLWFKWNEQSALDALAAQLVRQIDAHPDGFWSCGPTGTTISNSDGRCIGYTFSKGEDRTMNTIKAIVDSKVLQCTA